uniref:Penicillin-binding protein n=1 Tax=Clostridioides difficile TaxID=1496 RepID=A0A381I849_CLODI|nr:penicillin-binding protein [Clostridioides difficile]
MEVLVLQKLWEKIMEKIHANLTVTEFEVPKNVYFTKLI